MNDGALAGGTGGLCDALPVVGVQYNYAKTTYALTEPVSDTTVKDDTGSTVLSVTLNLPVKSIVIVRFQALVTKSSAGRTRVRIYDNAVQVAPVSASPTNWYSYYVGENSAQQIDIAAMLTLDAGTHVIDIRHQAALSTATITWGDRALAAYICRPVYTL